MAHIPDWVFTHSLSPSSALSSALPAYGGRHGVGNPSDESLPTSYPESELLPVGGSHDSLAARTVAGKEVVQGNLSYLYARPAMTSMPNTAGALYRSESATDLLSTSSPKSYWSDFSDRDQQAHETEIDESSPLSNWNSSEGSSFLSLERSTSYEFLDTGLGFTANPFHQGGAGEGFSGFPYGSLGTSVSNFQQDHAYGKHDLVHKSTEEFDWAGAAWASTTLNWSNAHGYTQGLVLGSAVGHQLFEQSFGFPGVREPRKNSSSQGTDAIAGIYTTASDQEVQLNGHPEPISNQSQYLQPSNAQRKFEDKILLDGKQAGMTYKEIKKQMKTDVAESTLRGRYRSLTKPRKDRVRKPVWTGKDVCDYLLKYENPY